VESGVPIRTQDPTAPSPAQQFATEQKIKSAEFDAKKATLDIYHRARFEKARLRDESERLMAMQDQFKPGTPQWEAHQKKMGATLDQMAYAAKRERELADYAEEEMRAIVSDVVGKKADQLSMERDGVGMVADPSKIQAEVDRISQQYGVRGGLAGLDTYGDEFRRTLYDRLKNAVDVAPKQKRADEIFQKEADIILEREGVRFKEGFKADAAIRQQAESRIAGIKTEVEAAMKQDNEQLLAGANEVYATLTAPIKGAEARLEQAAVQIQHQIELGVIPYEQGVQMLEQAQQEYAATYEQYKKDWETTADDLLRKSSALASRYNQRYQEQQRAILDAANKDIAAAAELYAKEFRADPMLQERLNAAYKGAWAQVQGEDDARLTGTEEARRLAIKQFSPVAAAMDVFTRNTITGLGGAFKGISTTLGFDGGYQLGEEMERAFYTPQPKSKKVSDLLDPMNFSALSGQLLGAMTPSLGASIATAYATGGTGTPVAVSMVTTALAGWGVETMDIAGRAKDQMLAKTGSMDKANEAWEKSLKSQVQLLPAYAFDGLPFVGKALKGVPTIGGRVAVGAGVEYVTETFQEIPQNIAERNILAGKEAWDDFAEGLMDPENKEVLIAMAPIALLGGGGQITSQSAKKEFAQAVKGYIGKGEVAKHIEGAESQWLAQMTVERGDKFAHAVLASLHQGGHINEQQLAKLEELRIKAMEHRGNAIDAGLNDREAGVYTAFSAMADDLRAKAESSTNPIERMLAKARLGEIEGTLKNFVLDKEADYVTVTYPDGKTSIMDAAAAKRMLQSEEFLKKASLLGLTKDGLQISGNGAESSMIVDQFTGQLATVNDRIAAMRMDPASAPITMQEVTERVDEVVNEALSEETKAPIATELPPDPESVSLSQEENDRVAQARLDLGIEVDPLEGLSDGMVVTFNRVENDLPVSLSAVEEVADFLYEKYKELRAMKSAPKGLLTMEQIDGFMEQLGQDIELLETYKQQQREKAEGSTEQAAPKPTVKADTGTGSQELQAKEEERRAIREEIASPQPTPNEAPTPRPTPTVEAAPPVSDVPAPAQPERTAEPATKEAPTPPEPTGRDAGVGEGRGRGPAVSTAPFYKLKVKDQEDADRLSQTPAYQNFKKTLESTASALGLKIASISPKLGKFDGALELSARVEFEPEADFEAVVDFAVLMGALSPESQESTIAGQYLHPSDPRVNYIETTITVGDVGRTSEIAASLDLDEFTADINGDNFVIFAPINSEALAKVEALVRKLTQDGTAKGYKHRTIISKYLDADARRERIETIGRRNQGRNRNGQSGSELRDIIAAAKKRDQDFQRLRKLEPTRKDYADLRGEQVKLHEKGEELEGDKLKGLKRLRRKLTGSIRKQFESWQDLYAESKAEISEFGDRVAKEFGAYNIPFHLKLPARAAEKTLDWYAGYPTLLGDGARTTIIVDDLAKADAILDRIKEDYYVVREENYTTDLGYPKRLIEVVTANGRIAEFQVMTPDAYLAKDGVKMFPDPKKAEASKLLSDIQDQLGALLPDGVGHLFYEVQRDPNVPKSLRDATVAPSALYYQAFLDPASMKGRGQEVISAVSDFLDAFEKESANESKWAAKHWTKNKELVEAVRSALAQPPVAPKPPKGETKETPPEVEKPQEEVKPASKAAKPTATPYKVERDPVSKPTLIAEAKDVVGPDGTKGAQKEWQVPGLDEYRLVTIKGKGGYKVYERASGAAISKETQPTESIALADAKEIINRNGKEKFEKAIEGVLEQRQSLAEKIRSLKVDTKGMAGSFIIPPQVWNAAVEAVALAAEAGAAVADAVRAGIQAIKDSDWYKSATAAGQKAAIQDFENKMGVVEKSIPAQKQVKQATGQRTMPLLPEDAKTPKDKVRLAAQSVMKGYGSGYAQGMLTGEMAGKKTGRQEGRADAKAEANRRSKEFAKEVKEVFKDLYGKMTPAQAKSLTTRALTTDPLNPKSISRFADHLEKVIDNANYSADVDAARQQQKKAKSILRRSGIPSNHVEILSRIRDINPESIDDPLAFAKLVSDYLGTFAAPSSQKYQMGSVLDMDAALSRYEKQQSNEFERMLMEEFGVEVEGMDAKAIYESLMDNPNMDAEDSELQKSLTPQQKRTITEKLIEQAAYSQMALIMDVDLNGFIPQEQRLIRALQDVDVRQLPPTKLPEYIRYVDNITVNNSLAGFKGIAATARSVVSNQKYRQGRDLSKVRQVWDSKLGSLAQEQLSSVSGAFRFLKGMTTEASDLIYALGLHDVNKQKALIDQDLRKVAKGLDDTLKEVGKRNKTANSAKNRVFEGGMSYVLQRIPGMDLNESFRANKEMVLEHIARAGQYANMQKEAAAVRDFYDELLEGTNTVEEFIDKVSKQYPENWKVLRHMMDAGKQFQNELLDHSEQMWNEAPVSRDDPYYMPKLTKKIKGEKLKTDENDFVKFAQSKGLGKPRQAGALKGRSKITSLPEGRVIDFNIRAGFLRRLKENLYDARTSEHWAHIHQFLELPGSEEIFGSLDNRDFVINRLNKLYRSQRGDVVVSGVADRIADSIATFGRKTAAGLALGGVTQAPKQFFDQMVNASINTDPVSVGEMLMEVYKANDLLSLGAIGERGELMGGTQWDNDLESKVSRLGEALQNEDVAKIRETIKNLNNFWLSALRVSDVAAARAAFLSFYKKGLEQSGQELRDWSEEAALVFEGDEARNRAFAYAEMMTDITQGSSDPSKLANLSQRTESGFANLAKAMINPFSTFSVSIRERIVNDVSDIKHYGAMGSSDPDAEKIRNRAIRSLSATVASQAVFGAVRLYIAKGLISMGAKGLLALVSSMSDDDEDKEKNIDKLVMVFEALYTIRMMDTDAYKAAIEAQKKQAKMTAMGPEYSEEREKKRDAEFKWKSAYSAFLRDMLAGGMTVFAEDGVIDAMNMLYYEGGLIMGFEGVRDKNGDPIEYSRWLRGKDTPFYRYGQGQSSTPLGVFGVIKDRFSKPMDAYSKATRSDQKREADRDDLRMREYKDRSEELNKVRDKFVQQHIDATTPEDYKRFNQEYSEWMKGLKAVGETDMALRSIDKAVRQAKADKNLDPWVREMKNKPSARIQALSVYQELRSATPEQKAELVQKLNTRMRAPDGSLKYVILTDKFRQEFKRLTELYGAP